MVIAPLLRQRISQDVSASILKRLKRLEDFAPFKTLKVYFLSGG